MFAPLVFPLPNPPHKGEGAGLRLLFPRVLGLQWQCDIRLELSRRSESSPPLWGRWAAAQRGSFAKGRAPWR
jgi:hypothetical protein